MRDQRLYLTRTYGASHGRSRNDLGETNTLSICRSLSDHDATNVASGMALEGARFARGGVVALLAGRALARPSEKPIRKACERVQALLQD